MEKDIIDMYERGLPIDFITTLIFYRLENKHSMYSKFEFGIFGALTRCAVRKEVVNIIIEHCKRKKLLDIIEMENTKNG